MVDAKELPHKSFELNVAYVAHEVKKKNTTRISPAIGKLAESYIGANLATVSDIGT